jgi:hypothetical protein
MRNIGRTFIYTQLFDRARVKKLRYALALSVTTALTALIGACGGGDGATSSAGNAAGVEQTNYTAVQKASNNSNAKQTVSNNVWTKCADQGGFCAFVGTKAMRYGSGNQWSETIIFEAGPMGGAICSDDSSFANVPASGECQISGVVDDNVDTRVAQGEWSGVQSWPIVPVHATLLPSGRILSHNATNDDLWPAKSVITQVWDPIKNTLTGVDSRESTLKSELFCTGFTHLADGSLMTTGSEPNKNADTNKNTNRFNFFTQTWSREADTSKFRYYPSVATLPNGDLITFAGTRNAAAAESVRFDGSWKSLSGMSLAQDFLNYPWGQTAPNGKLFYAGPDSSMRYIDPVGAGTMTEVGQRDALTRGYGSYATYDIGKILIAGGAQPATNSALVVNLNAAAPTVTPTGSMANARRHGNLTIMADGSVLATGGYYGSEGFDVTGYNSVKQAERWNPSTGQWTPMASAQRIRGYHSVGILLPDGRVAVGGNGMPYVTKFNQQNMEIYSPPYLFAASSNGTGSYASKSGVTGSFNCNDATFGNPAPGATKVCAYVASSGGNPVTPPATPPPGAIGCAGEDATCLLPAGVKATVYYGANNKYFNKVDVTGSVVCSNATFGDPIYGVVKSCSYVANTAPPVTPPGIPPASAIGCADEDATCLLPVGAKATVYYGANNKYFNKTGVTGSVVCSNAVFGDPIYLTAKSCSYVVEGSTQPPPNTPPANTPPSNAVTCAAEDGNCVVPAGTTATVYYGANNKYFYKTNVSGSLACSNAVFGDPIYLTAKGCSYVLNTPAAGAVTSLPAGAQQCAVEGGVCTLPSGVTAVVYYGAASGGAGGSTLAVRPTIAYAPESVGYANSFKVTVGQTSNIAKVHLIKLGSVTHSNNQGQRLVPLSFTVNGANLQVNAPSNPNIAPPGYYMLFVVDSKGVPSVSKMVQVQQQAVVALVSRQTGKALEVIPGASGAGTAVQMAGDADQPSLAKSWDMVPTDSGYFKFVSRANGQVLSVPGSSQNVGIPIQALVDASGAHQQWKLTSSALGYYTVKARHSGFGLEVSGASTAEGAAVIQQQLPAVAGAHDEWIVLPVGYQRLVGVQSGKVAEVAGRSATTGAGLSIAPNAGDTHQSFRFVPRSDGYFSIEAAHSGNVVGVANGSGASGALLQQQAWSGANSQQWALVPQNDGSFIFKARHSGQYMNVQGEKIDTGISMVQAVDSGASNQLWRLIPAVSLDPHQRTVAGRAIASAHVSNIGWVPYVAASNTIGQPETSNSLEAVKISTKGIRTGLQISYSVRRPDLGWAAPVGDNQQAGTIGQSTPIQGFQASLGGTRDGCSIRYRGYIKGAGWQAWSTEGQAAGGTDPAKPLTGLQMQVECTTATMAYKP